jgi:hypothetical protein
MNAIEFINKLSRRDQSAEPSICRTCHAFNERKGRVDGVTWQLRETDETKIGKFSGNYPIARTRSETNKMVVARIINHFLIDVGGGAQIHWTR